MEHFVHNANIEHYRRLPAPAREMLFAAVHESLVGTFRTNAITLTMSAPRGTADIAVAHAQVRE
jgi:hypothetical protein